MGQARCLPTSFSRFCHSSLSRGPALTVRSGIFWTVARVVGSHDWSPILDVPCSALQGIKPMDGRRQGQRRGCVAGEQSAARRDPDRLLLRNE